MSQVEQPKLGENNLIIDINDSALAQEVVLSQLSQAQSTIKILSQHLESKLYSNANCCFALKRLITSNRRSKIQIICLDSSPAILNGHVLVDLAHHFSSFIEIRTPMTNEHLNFNESWLMVDDCAYSQFKDIKRFTGSACFNDRLKTRESIKYFDHCWEQSEIDQKTRRMSL